MVTADRSPRMMAQKGQVAGISREPTAARHWLRVVFVPAAVILSPCWVMLMFLIVTPAGSFGILMLKFTRLPRTLDGNPPKSVTWTLILSPPTWVTLTVA